MILRPAGQRVGALPLLLLELGYLVERPRSAEQLPGLSPRLLGVKELRDPLQSEILLCGGQGEHPLLDLRVIEASDNDVTAQLV